MSPATDGGLSAGGAFRTGGTGNGDGSGDASPGVPADVPVWHDERVTTVEEIRHVVAEHNVMLLAESLLAIKAGWDAASDGAVAPDMEVGSVTPQDYDDAMEALPAPSVARRDVPVADVSAEDLVSRPMTPREAFDARRGEEFLDDFRARTEDAVRSWCEEWVRWRDSHARLAEVLRENLLGSRGHHHADFVDLEVESMMRERYDDEVPCPDDRLVLQWETYGRLLTGGEELWPGYAESRRVWDEESERMWDEATRAA